MNEIMMMPHYFKGQKTSVHSITQEEMTENHQGMAHGGHVLRQGESTADHQHLMSFSLALDSNPEFTALVLIAYAKAAYRLNQKGQYGAMTILDVPVSALSDLSLVEQIKHYV